MIRQTPALVSFVVVLAALVGAEGSFRHGLPLLGGCAILLAIAALIMTAQNHRADSQRAREHADRGWGR